MFDELSNKLDGALKKLRQRGVLTEPMIKEGLREVRRVLLEADVNFKVTRHFLARVQERALGEAVLKAVSPGQQIVKIVHDELAHLFGEGVPTLAVASDPPTVILMVGLQGSGKTTSSAKLARRLGREGRTPMLAACDLQRPAAIEQLQALGEQIGASVVAGEFGGDPVAAARSAVQRAKEAGHSVLIVDTAGRLQIDEPLMAELGKIRDAVQPSEILLVADAMTGQEAVKIAQGFDEALGITGIVMTKMDGDARGGAALSIRGVTGKPIKFVGVGEGVDDLDTADPERLAGRILQMGDVIGLVEGDQATGEGARARTLHARGLSRRDASGAEDGPHGSTAETDPGGGPHEVARGEPRPQALQARGGDHPVHDAGGASQAGDSQRVAALEDCERERSAGSRGEPPHEAVQGNAEVHEANEGDDGRRRIPGHGRWLSWDAPGVATAVQPP